MKIFVYDYAIQGIGGGQKVACTIASILSKYHNVYMNINRLPPDMLEEYYAVDLSKVNIVELANDSKVTEFSSTCDLFINCEHAAWIKPMAKSNMIIVHFPRPVRLPPVHIHDYDEVYCNSNYGKEWVERDWKVPAKVLRLFCNFEPTYKIQEKENIILSVSRLAHNKQQAKMAEIFHNSDINAKFIIAGRRFGDPYYNEVKKAVELDNRIELREDLTYGWLRSLYSKSKVFWHICGMGVEELQHPEWLEHFGLVVLEAMKCESVPIVFNGGGHTDIIKDFGNGFLINNKEELVSKTVRVLADEGLRKGMIEDAKHTLDFYSVEQFETRLLGEIECLQNKK